MKIDDYGRISYTENEIIEFLYSNINISNLFLSDDITNYNENCKKYNKDSYMIKKLPKILHSPEIEHKNRKSRWFYPSEYDSINIREYLLNLCKTDIEIQRVNLEMDLYEKREMISILRLMIYLVDHFKKNNVIFGVGRGSSVASYVLYLIGIHKIDSIKYNLDINEFLR